MKVQFNDLQDEKNARSGHSSSDVAHVLALLDDLTSRPPFICELIGENGFMLTIGIGPHLGCVQHMRSDGNPPYLMAVNPAQPQTQDQEVELMCGGPPAPIDVRDCLTFDEVKKLVAYFVETG